MKQLTFFDDTPEASPAANNPERDKAVELAKVAAWKFAQAHSSRFFDVDDYKSEAVAFVLQYLQEPDFALRYVSRRVFCHLSHKLEAVDFNIRRARDGRPQIAETPVEKPDEAFAASVQELPLEIAIEVGALIATYSPPVAAAITDVLNGFTKKDAAARNKLTVKAFWRYFSDFKEKAKNLL